MWRRLVVDEGREVVVGTAPPDSWLSVKSRENTAFFLLTDRPVAWSQLVQAATEAGVALMTSRAELAVWIEIAEPPRPKFGTLLFEFLQKTCWDPQEGQYAWNRLMEHYPEASDLRPFGGELAQLVREGKRRVGAGSSVEELLVAAGRLHPREQVHHLAAAVLTGALQKEARFVEAKRAQRAPPAPAAAIPQGTPKAGNNPSPSSTPPALPAAILRLDPKGRSARIDGLPRAAAYTLLIDETGSRFDAGGNGRDGRWVGVLIPDGVQLPDLLSFHATSETPARFAEAVQRVLDHEVGVISLGLQAVPPISGDGWAAGIMAILDWVQRLIPTMEPGGVIKVLVEQRTVVKADQDVRTWSAEWERGLRERGHTPKFKVDLKIVNKAHPQIAYADAIAGLWGTEHGKRMLPDSGLSACAIHAEGMLLGRVLDAHRGQVSGEDWMALLTLADASYFDDLAQLASARLQSIIRADAGTWRYFQELHSALLETKAADNKQIALQSDFLEEVGYTLRTPVQDLEWKISRLKLENHLGDVAAARSREVGALSARLREEVPSLACEADLVRAVAAMNAFQYADAEKIVGPWAKAAPIEAGLQYWARAQSTMGQLHAFQGRNAEAQARFHEALQAFARLSDPTMAEQERAHTGTYLVIAEMDDLQISTEDARARLLMWARQPDMPSLILEAVSTENRYFHHVVARFLVHRGTLEEQSAYLSQLGGRWASLEPGHPWPQIGAYRALMRGGPEGLALLKRAVVLAWEQEEPTMTYIGLVLHRVYTYLGAPPLDEAAKKRESLAAVRHFQKAKLALLDAPLLSPQVFIRNCLPFNFS